MGHLTKGGGEASKDWKGAKLPPSCFSGSGETSQGSFSEGNRADLLLHFISSQPRPSPQLRTHPPGGRGEEEEEEDLLQRSGSPG